MNTLKIANLVFVNTNIYNKYSCTLEYEYKISNNISIYLTIYKDRYFLFKFCSSSYDKDIASFDIPDANDNYQEIIDANLVSLLHNINSFLIELEVIKQAYDHLDKALPERILL